MNYRALAVVLATTALLLSAGGAHAQAEIGTVPPVVKDLVGSRAAGAESDMKTRGLEFVRTENSDNGKNSYWREVGTGGCIFVRTEDGRIANASYTEPQNCGSSGSSSAMKSGEPSKSARVACKNRFGADKFKSFETISPLKPGYWELIMAGKNGKRAACTVSDSGKIEDWVNL